MFKIDKIFKFGHQQYLENPTTDLFLVISFRN